MDLVNNYIYILEIPINIISLKLRSYSKTNVNEKRERIFTLSFLVLLLKAHNRL
jgi:hypothetical protein